MNQAFAEKIDKQASSELWTNETRSAPMAVGFWPRALSYLFDLVFAFLFGMVIGLCLVMIVEITGLAFPIYGIDDGQSALGGLGLDFVLTITYFSVFEWLFGATPGKAIMRLRVISVDGRRCTLIGALVRGAARFIDGLFFGVVAAISMQGSQNQRVGDKLAHTLVVNSQDVIINERRSWWWFVFAGALAVIVGALEYGVYLFFL